MKLITNDEELVKALNKIMARLTPCSTTLGARMRENLRRFVHEQKLDHSQYHFAELPLQEKQENASSRSCTSTRHEAGRPATRVGAWFALCDECWELLMEAP